MPASVKAVASVLEKAYPPEIACDWDNVGLEVGDPAAPVARVIVTLDVDEALILKAAKEKRTMIVSHHPLIVFTSLTRIVPGTSTASTLAYRAASLGVPIYSAHTNCDFAPGGLNDRVCELLGMEDSSPLRRERIGSYSKIVVFVPYGHEDKVRSAMAKAGAGWIGNYSDCSFMTGGMGSFLAREGTNPFLGREGILEKAEEFRLEMILPTEKSESVIQAMTAAHPYEEVAYDLYDLARPARFREEGRIGALARAMTPEGFAAHVKKALGLKRVSIVKGRPRKIRRVAVVNGGGGSHLADAFGKADAFVTSDLKHHEAREAEAQGLMVVETSHYASEIPFVDLVGDLLKKSGLKIAVKKHRGRDPLERV